MNDQPAILPVEPRRNSKVSLVALIAFLVIGVVAFGFLSAYLYTRSSHDRSTLNAQKASAAADARADQKKIDAADAVLAAETPYRSYVAPVDYGAFEIKFPKNWSSFVDEEKTGTQVTLILNPNHVYRADGIYVPSAAKVNLIQRNAADLSKTYSSNKKLQSKSVVVSGLNGTLYTGDFGDKRTVRLILVPVRDKTMVFTSENAAYAREFDEIVAQSKIVP